MAASWARLLSKVFTISSKFSSPRNVLYNTAVVKPCFNQYKAGLKTLEPGVIQFREFSQTIPVMQHIFVHNTQLEAKVGSILIPKIVGGPFLIKRHFGEVFLAKRESFLPRNMFSGVLRRGVTTYSKKGKRKTCKAVAKRFIRTGKGKLKRWRCGYHHNQTKKSSRRKRFLRKPTYASKTQLKKLNKMLNGW